MAEPAPRGRWRYDEAKDEVVEVVKPEPAPEPPAQDDDDDFPGQYL